MIDRHAGDPIPPVLLAAFEHRISLTPKETARLLGMDYSTLQRHVKAGNIRFRAMGVGVVRPRREFTLADVLEFLERQRRLACPSTSGPTRRTTTTTSSAVVYGFTAQREKRLAARRKSSSGPKKSG
ncbi:helix-turn-helix domain-containing protein [Ancylobacter tetraedralis]|uniref:helix-turn-helix domain-containing protein n=1 Tax=Ancylobacter tetraedralis TaxID=217068 RepID=UPI003CCCF14F